MACHLSVGGNCRDAIKAEEPQFHHGRWMGPSTTTWAVESEYGGVAGMRLQWSDINPDAANMGVQTRLSSATPVYSVSGHGGIVDMLSERGVLALARHQQMRVGMVELWAHYGSGTMSIATLRTRLMELHFHDLLEVCVRALLRCYRYWRAMSISTCQTLVVEHHFHGLPRMGARELRS